MRMSRGAKERSSLRMPCHETSGSLPGSDYPVHVNNAYSLAIFENGDYLSTTVISFWSLAHLPLGAPASSHSRKVSLVEMHTSHN